MKINIISFATNTWQKALLRFNNSINVIQKNFNFFNSAKIYTENDLGEDYYSIFGKYIQNHGFANWSWKPYIIKKYLEQLEDNEYLMYMDGGCNINISNINFTYNCLFLLLQKMYLLHQFKLMFGIGINARHPVWCKNIIVQVKKEILKEFNLIDNKEFLYDYPHFEAGVFILCKNKRTVELIDKWYNFFVKNYETIIVDKNNDFHNKENQYPEFVHNGSDQSILQCILYKYYKDEFMNLQNMWYDTRIYTRIKG